MRVFKDVKIPRRSTFGSAGYDFCSPDTYELTPNEWTMIDTGVSLDESKFGTDLERWFMLLVPRSGLSNKYGLRIRNTVGIIDMDYKDTIKAMITVDEAYTLQKGERFLQGIVVPFGTFIDEISPTGSRNGGHGSTGRF